jgi:hypothetical protein
LLKPMLNSDIEFVMGVILVQVMDTEALVSLAAMGIRLIVAIVAVALKSAAQEEGEDVAFLKNLADIVVHGVQDPAREEEDAAQAREAVQAGEAVLAEEVTQNLVTRRDVILRNARSLTLKSARSPTQRRSARNLTLKGARNHALNLAVKREGELAQAATVAESN